MPVVNCDKVIKFLPERKALDSENVVEVGSLNAASSPARTLLEKIVVIIGSFATCEIFLDREGAVAFCFNKHARRNVFGDSGLRKTTYFFEGLA